MSLTNYYQKVTLRLENDAFPWIGSKPIKVPENYIERQLSHKAAAPLGTAYDRAKYIDDRIPMMQAWAGYLDDLKAGAKVMPLHGNAG